MIRHGHSELANQESAGKLSPSIQHQLLTELAKYFKNRLARTQSLPDNLRELLPPELENYIEIFIASALQNWQQLVDNQDGESYSLRYSGSAFLNELGRTHTKWKDLFLALDAYMDDEAVNMWAVPMSLRTVESEAVLNVKEK